MIYVYSCSVCTHYNEEYIKSVVEFSENENGDCGHELHLVPSWQGHFALGDISFLPNYQPAFGKVITNPRQLKDELKKSKYEKGVELECVGNDKVESKPPRSEYDWDGAGREIHQAIRKIKSNGRVSRT